MCMKYFSFLLLQLLLGSAQSLPALDASQGDSEAVRCYICDSGQEDCTEDVFGDEKECEPGQGCVISVEKTAAGKEELRRECSRESDVEDSCEEGQTDGVTITSCHCSTNLCNSDLAEAGYTGHPSDTTAASSEAVKCYGCTSLDGGRCNEEEFGEEKECQPGFGCLISKETKPSRNQTFFLRDCIPGAETDNKCNTNQGAEEGVILQSCSCSTELCNKNWVEAGSTENPVDTTEAPEAIKCFACSSIDEGHCTDDYPGASKQCEPGHGCMITLETKVGKEDVLIRDCSQEYGNGKFECNSIGGDDATLSTCNCKTPLCNRNWAEAGSTPGGPTDAPTEPADKTVKCYSCDSNEGGCNDDEAGEEVDCPMEAGCLITKDVSDDGTLFLRGCTGAMGPEPGWSGCSKEGGATTCICLGVLCNFDWTTAGSTTANSDTTKPTETTPQGPTLKCYKCDSTGNDCTDIFHGEEVECPESKGCTISKTTGTDGDDLMMRDCSSEKDVLCDTIDNGDGKGTTQFCNCDSSLCNADWTTAGSTETTKKTTPSVTKETTQGAETTTQVVAPGAATRTSSYIALALGIVSTLLSF